MFLVTGATGALGRRIVREIRQQDQPVRAFEWYIWNGLEAHSTRV